MKDSRHGPAAYGWLLWLGPRALRERHAPEMATLFGEQLAEARARGRAAVALTWMRAAVDLLHASVAHYRRQRSFVRPIVQRHVFMTRIDLVSAVRSLSRQKYSTALAIGMLSLGMAANVAIFSLVNGLFLRPLRFSEAERLVYINEVAPKWNLNETGINYPDFDRWRKDQQLFESIALYDGAAFNLSDNRGAERIEGAQVTYDYATVLRLRPELGRLFTADDDKPNGPRVILIGYGLWRERFGSDPNVVGQTIRLDEVPYSIVGVLPPEAEFPNRGRFWVPFQGDPNQTYQSYGASGVGRLKPGVSAADGEADLRRAHTPIWEARDKERVVSPFARPLQGYLAGDFWASARILAAAVALLLIVACANVASIMLARALTRRREMGIRLALGAGRSHLVRQLFIENLILSLVAGVIGLAAGAWAAHALVGLMDDRVPVWAAFGLDVRVILFAITAVVATAVLFGWAPALHSMGGDLRSAVQETTHGTTAPPRARRTLKLLVGVEFALAAVLLVCGGLLLRAYDRVRNVDPGFRVDHMMMFSVALPDSAYPDDKARSAFWNRLVERLRPLPGIEAVGLVTCPPLGCHWGMFFQMEGETPPAPGQARPVTLFRSASADYFKAMGIRLVSGRVFDDRDFQETAGLPVVVNETFARTYWPGVADPVGRRMRGAGGRADAPWMTVVGVVADVKHYGLERSMRPGIYRPTTQVRRNTLTVVLHTSVEPTAVVASTRGVLTELDPHLAVYQLRTMEEAVSRSLADRAIYSTLLAVFATLALVLALGGAYGLASYLVTQRTREIGIRIALGARGVHIVRAALGSNLWPVAAGIVTGVTGALLMSRWLSSLLFGVPAHDAPVLTLAVIVLLATAMIANGLPALRARRIHPMHSLRME